MQQNPLDRERADTPVPNLGPTAQSGSVYTNEEWKVLAETPVKIGRAMMAVSPSGALGMTQEVMALRKCCSEALQTTSSPILQELRQQLQGQDTLSYIWQEAGHAFSNRWDASNVRQTALAACQQIGALLRKVSAQDAQAYKEFIYNTALKVAQAAKEGGTFGIGGVSVSENEKTLLNEISNTLGLQH